MVDLGKFAPERESVIIAGDPVDGLFFQLDIIFPGGFLDDIKVDDCLLPGLFQDCYGKISFGSIFRLCFSYIVTIR